MDDQRARLKNHNNQTRRIVKNLIYKRGYGTLNKQRIPLTSNEIIESGLGNLGIRCIEDLVHEVYTLGDNFKEATHFL